MNKSTPSRKLPAWGAFLKLLFSGWIISNAVGCSVLSVRNSDCCPGPGETTLSEQASCHESATECCDSSEFVPTLPQIPLPGCVKKWKEHGDLPAGPQGLKFHPLPTRPMFQARPGSTPIDHNWNCQDPNQQGSMVQGPLPLAAPGYGSIPARSQWSQLQPAAEPTNSEAGKKPSTDNRKQKTEELPKPIDESP